MNKILLSFCVPTYNRPKDFSRLLESLAPQMTDEVELVLGDDGDMAAIAEVLKNFPNINIDHFKNTEGRGFDKNLLAVTRRARGRYVWWCGDDDEVTPGAIKRVLEIITKYKDISFIFVNSQIYDQDFPTASLGEDKFFKDRNQVFDELANRLTFISALIFKKDAMGDLSTDSLSRFVGTGFVNFYLTIRILSKKGKFYFLSNPYIICHPTSKDKIVTQVVHGESIDNPYFEIFGVTFFDIIQEFKSSFDERSVRKMLAYNFSNLWRGILVGWVGGWDTPNGKRWKMLEMYWSYPEFWIAMPILCIPLSINKGLYRIYKLFFNERRWRWGGRKQ